MKYFLTFHHKYFGVHQLTDCRNRDMLSEKTLISLMEKYASLENIMSSRIGNQT